MSGKVLVSEQKSEHLRIDINNQQIQSQQLIQSNIMADLDISTSPEGTEGSKLQEKSKDSPNVSQSSRSKSRSRSVSLSLRKSLDKELLHQISMWIQTLSLQKSKSISQVRIERDYADGYLVAEIISQHHPKLVDIHNYAHGSSSSVKRHNWIHLRRKVLSKLNIDLSDEEIEFIIESKPGGIDRVLKEIYDIAMRIESEKREAEEEKARESVDHLPPDEWKQDICFVRKGQGGQREYMIQSKLLVNKDQMLQEIQTRDKELEELRLSNNQLKAQVARLQMTVSLKEDRLGELTHQLSLCHRQSKKLDESFGNPKEMIPGAYGDMLSVLTPRPPVPDRPRRQFHN